MRACVAWRRSPSTTQQEQHARSQRAATPGSPRSPPRGRPSATGSGCSPPTCRTAATTRHAFSWSGARPRHRSHPRRGEGNTGGRPRFLSRWKTARGPSSTSYSPSHVRVSTCRSSSPVPGPPRGATALSLNSRGAPRKQRQAGPSANWRTGPARSASSAPSTRGGLRPGSSREYYRRGGAPPGAGAPGGHPPESAAGPCPSGQQS